MERHDEANARFLQFCERTKILFDLLALYCSIHAASLLATVYHYS
jgi:hypothetical protein